MKRVKYLLAAVATIALIGTRPLRASAQATEDDPQHPAGQSVQSTAPPAATPGAGAQSGMMGGQGMMDMGGQAMMQMMGGGDAAGVPGATKPETSLMFNLNQFMLYSSTFGPRGQSRFTGPGLWMVMYDKALSPTNHLRIDVMGSPEQLTVGDKGTPQLLQTEHVDSMHAHDTIMALEFRDVLTLGTDGKQQLTFLFAPRGGAAVGPVPFMHRESAEGNPDAPLAHALQDGFHDVSTVLGIEYQIARTTVEATAFSGQGVSWPLPLYRPDSYSLRVNQGIDDHFSVGASYADALLPDDAGGAEHNQFIWGQARAGHGASLNSFLEEVVYQRGNNKIYGRAEILQIAPMQLDLVLASGGADAKWVEAFTVGYERTLFKKDELSPLVGGSYTKDLVAAEFQPAYGSDPEGVKVYLRIKIDGLSMIGKAMHAH